jgi:hypothetical protein
MPWPALAASDMQAAGIQLHMESHWLSYTLHESPQLDASSNMCFLQYLTTKQRQLECPCRN